MPLLCLELLWCPRKLRLQRQLQPYTPSQLQPGQQLPLPLQMRHLQQTALAQRPRLLQLLVHWPWLQLLLLLAVGY